MEINHYYLESIKESETSPNMCTIIISIYNHMACIEVHGDRITATERAIVIINALNEHERDKHDKTK